ncbi:MAG: hypothetical protein F8N37_23915 [Telmatospirillum sp.]|nr:hypothetical protein [Telmatospirillum sp.]
MISKTNRIALAVSAAILAGVSLSAAQAAGSPRDPLSPAFVSAAALPGVQGVSDPCGPGRVKGPLGY